MTDLHRRLYNAALEERISAWRLSKKSITCADQQKSLTLIRADDPDYASLNAQSCQVTLKRLDDAMKAFFRRAKSGETPGFPRFKSRDRFSGFGYKKHGDGFRFNPGKGWKNGYLRLSGIGWIQARGEARTPGEIKTCSITRKSDGWFLSLVVSCEPHREISLDAHEIGTLDWGLETYATLTRGLGDFDMIPNDRFWSNEAAALKEDQRDLSKALRGKRSKSAAKKRRALARRHRKLANRRKNRSHQVSSDLIREYKTLVTEKLTPKNMTRSARGTGQDPGKNVAQKAGLNRSILDTAPGDLLSMLTYKAEEAGSELVILPTKSLKPSQRCPVSWVVKKKTLNERTHMLPDGTMIGRDHAAGLVMLRATVNQNGREPAWIP